MSLRRGSTSCFLCLRLCGTSASLSGTTRVTLIVARRPASPEDGRRVYGRFVRWTPDNTASILTRRGGFLQQDQMVHLLPVVISDSSRPSLSSTNTLSITVCACDAAGQPRSCRQGATPLLLVSLQTAVTAAVLTCILTLLGKRCNQSPAPFTPTCRATALMNNEA